MTDGARAASDRRAGLILTALGVAALVGIVVVFRAGKSLRAPSSAFDKEGTARLLGEGMNQVATTAQAGAVRATAAGHSA